VFHLMEIGGRFSGEGRLMDFVVLSLLSLDSGERRRVWRGEGWAGGGLRWSPDGRLIAVSHFFWSEETENDEIVIRIIAPPTERSGSPASTPCSSPPPPDPG
jgi:hypothetical protein